MAKLFDLPRYIAVEGPIRVGKSTLSTILAERLNAQRVTDPEHNSFLAPFYQGQAGAAFQAQFTFLVQRFEQLRALDLGARSQKAHAEWNALAAAYGKEFPDLAEQQARMQKRELPDGWDKDLPTFAADAKGLASRQSSQTVLNALANAR